MNLDPTPSLLTECQSKEQNNYIDFNSLCSSPSTSEGEERHGKKRKLFSHIPESSQSVITGAVGREKFYQLFHSNRTDC